MMGEKEKQMKIQIQTKLLSHKKFNLGASYNMGKETKYKEQLKFRRRKKDFDTPSNESNSSSSSASARRKHKLVSSLISLDKGQAMNNCRVRKNDKIGLSNDRQLHCKKEKRESIERTAKGSSTKKNTETSGDEFGALDDVKLFMASLLEDLKVGRENLFVWMKEEMQKLVIDDTDSQWDKREFIYKRRSVQMDDQDNFEDFPTQHQNKFQGAKVQHPKDFEENADVQAQNNFKSRIREQTSNDRTLERSLESEDESGFDNCYQTLEDLDDYAQHVKPNTKSWPANSSTEMHHQKNFLSGRKSEDCNGGNVVSFMEGKRTPNSSFHGVLNHRGTYDQEIGSITSSWKEKREDLGLSNDSKDLGPSNDSNITFHPPNQAASSMYLMLPTASTAPPSLHHGYFFGGQMEEPKRSFDRLYSGNVGFFVQRNSTNSVIGTDFPVSLHQDINTGFSIPRNRFIFEQERDNISGLKMDGEAMNFSGGSYDLSEHYFANKFISNSN